MTAKNTKAPHIEFSHDLAASIRNAISDALKASKGPAYAAFDADGTLWDTDAGEAFFEYQIQKCQLKFTDPQTGETIGDPWEHYHRWKEKETRAAYLWLAQVSQGKTLEQVRQWAEQAFLEQSGGSAGYPFFRSQKDLISDLQGLGVNVFVVTASVKWAVEPALKRLGIPPENALGIRTKVSNGIVGLEQDGVITWREGKALALLAATGGVPPIFCAGNTVGDLALLESATHVRLAVRSQNAHPELTRAEEELFKIAQARAWFTHQF